MTANDWDKALLALVAWREARGEGKEGMRAVMHVVQNRVAKWRATYNATICERDQFTSISVHGDPETVSWPNRWDPQFLFCLDLVDEVLENRDPDPTLGSLFYENPAAARSLWFQLHVIDDPGFELKATIGRQNFYGPKAAAGAA